MTNVESRGLMQYGKHEYEAHDSNWRVGDHSIPIFLVLAAVVGFATGCVSDVRREIRFAWRF